MLNILSHHTSISAKAKAMFGKRLTYIDYKELLKKKSVSEIAYYLKNYTHYKQSLSSVDDNNIHRGQLELILKKDLFKRYEKLCRYLVSKKNRFFYYYITKAEVQQILRCIMLLNSNSMDDFIVELPGFLISSSTFDLLSLAKVRCFEDLENVLKNSHYKNVIKKCKPDKNDIIDYTMSEILLRSHQYKIILDLINKNFKNKEKKSIEKAFKLEIDLLNIASIFRLKKYFNMTPDKIKSKLIPFGYFLNKDKLDRLISSDLNKNFYIICNNIFKSIYNSDENFKIIEKYIHTLKYKYNKKLLYFSTFSSCTFYSLFVLSEIELENIIKIIEGIRYKVDVNEIKELIIL